jgi:hypothetical protein
LANRAWNLCPHRTPDLNQRLQRPCLVSAKSHSSSSILVPKTLRAGFPKCGFPLLLRSRAKSRLRLVPHCGVLWRASSRPNRWADTPEFVAPERVQCGRAKAPSRLRPLPQNERLRRHGVHQGLRGCGCLVVAATSHIFEAY